MVAKKVLITGATGFLGSHLTRRLIAKGLTVGIIKRKHSDAWRIKDLLSRIKSYSVSLQDTRSVSRVVSDFRPDIIFHLAAHYAVEHEPRQIAPMVDTNVLGAINLLEAARESAVRLFVNTSSCFVYKASDRQLKENSTLEPLNLYGLTKIQAEGVCSYYAGAYQLPCVTFRIFPPYGPLDNERRLIPYIINSLLKGEHPKLTTGKQRWDFVYVDDIVEAYVRLLSIPAFSKKHEIFNIGTGEAVSVRRIGSRLSEIIGGDISWGKIAHRKNEIWHIRADIRKAKALLAWEPRIGVLKEGLLRTVASHRKYKNKGKKT